MQLLTLSEGAELIGVNPRTLRRRIADGTLPAYRFKNGLDRLGRPRGHIRVRQEDLEALFRPIPAVRTVA